MRYVGLGFDAQLLAQGLAGIDRGQSVSLRCPQNQAVSGISGKSGWYVDQLRIHCDPLGERGQLNPDPVTIRQATPVAGHIGGEGGDSFGPFLCTNSQPGKGLRGQAGDWIDRIALVCENPSFLPPVVKQIDVAVRVVGGTSTTGTIFLNAKALGFPIPATFHLSTTNPNVVSFESNPISVAPGLQGAHFVVRTNPVSSPVTTVISASPNNGSALSSRPLTILPPSLQSVSLSRTSTAPGGSVTGTVSLDGKAFAGGVSVILGSSGTAAVSVPASVQIAQNQTSATFPVTVGSANQTHCSIISASYNEVRRGVVLGVPIPANPAFTLSIIPNSRSLTIRFPSSSNAPRALSVTSSNPSVISVPAAVAVPAGAPSANFEFARTPAGSSVSSKLRPGGQTSPGQVGVTGFASFGVGGVTCAVVTATDTAGNKNSLILSIQGESVSAIY